MNFLKNILLGFVLLCAFKLNLHAERIDSINYKVGVGYALLPGLTNLDAGLNFEFRLKKNHFLEAAYYYRFHGISIVRGAACYKYLPTHGYSIQLGFRNYRKRKDSKKNFFDEFRLTYKNIHIPNHDWVEDYGLDLVVRQNRAVWVNTLRAVFALGRKQVYKNKFYVEESFSAGLEYRAEDIRIYRSWSDLSHVNYYDRRFSYKKTVYPHLEFNLRIGFGL